MTYFLNYLYFKKLIFKQEKIINTKNNKRKKAVNTKSDKQ